MARRLTYILSDAIFTFLLTFWHKNTYETRYQHNPCCPGRTGFQGQRIRAARRAARACPAQRGAFPRHRLSHHDRPRQIHPPHPGCRGERLLHRGSAPERRDRGEPGSGRPLSLRHRLPHPQDPRNARRHPYGHTPGIQAHRSGRRGQLRSIYHRPRPVSGRQGV